MKKKLAALLTLLLVFATACAKKTPPIAPPVPAPEQEQQAAEQTPVEQPSKIIEPEVQTPPSAEENGLLVDFTDTPQREQADIEEIVSYDISVPQLTLPDSAAAENINAGFMKLSESLVSYAHETVYAAAQEQGTIGFLETRYDVRAEDGRVIVDFTVTETYGDGAPQTSTTRYVFDAATGARLTDE